MRIKIDAKPNETEGLYSFIPRRLPRGRFMFKSAVFIKSKYLTFYCNKGYYECFEGYSLNQIRLRLSKNQKPIYKVFQSTIGG